MHISVVDAFTSTPFTGNPAAVAVIDQFPADDRMRLIAREMNLSETAFVVPRGGRGYDLRWFTPTAEVDLCGHATLAAAHLVGGSPVFHTRSGPLRCQTSGATVTMTFPRWEPLAAELPSQLPGLLEPTWTGIAGDDWFVCMKDAATVEEYIPDLDAISALGRRALILTAPADEAAREDFVSRVFGPNVGINEDPVTGSSHCALGPYWADALGRTSLLGRQASARGGYVRVEVTADEVMLSGEAVIVSEVKLLA